MDRMRGVIAPFSRLAVPAVMGEFSTSRLLVMQDVQGGPLSIAPEGTARDEAARQLLESFYKQIMVDGFFHADPHPGNLMWQPTEDKLYFLDLGKYLTLESLKANRGRLTDLRAAHAFLFAAVFVVFRLLGGPGGG